MTILQQAHPVDPQVRAENLRKLQAVELKTRTSGVPPGPSLRAAPARCCARRVPAFETERTNEQEIDET